jgi:hypothetical protein
MSAPPAEMIRYLPFPFPGRGFPAELGAVIQRTVLDGREPAREVIHSAEDSWMVGDGLNDPNVPGACVARHIHHVLARNSSVAALASYQPDKKLRERAVAAIATLTTQGRAVGYCVVGALKDPRKDVLTTRNLSRERDDAIAVAMSSALAGARKKAARTRSGTQRARGRGRAS